MNEKRGKFVYIAGSWDDRETIKDIAKKVEDNGGIVDCKWFYDQPIASIDALDWYTHPEIEKRFIRDINGCDDCNTFVLYMGKGSKLQGALVELGVCYSLEYPRRPKRYIAIGKPVKSVMLRKIDKWYDSVDDMLEQEEWFNE